MYESIELPAVQSLETAAGSLRLQGPPVHKITVNPSGWYQSGDSNNPFASFALLATCNTLRVASVPLGKFPAPNGNFAGYPLGTA